MSEQNDQHLQYPWDSLKGMTEENAEAYMLKHWGHIPPDWNDPTFRDQVTGISGQAELDAHMNYGEQAYGGQSRLGDQAKDVWYRRNIAGQGHPAEPEWVTKNRPQPNSSTK